MKPVGRPGTPRGCHRTTAGKSGPGPAGGHRFARSGKPCQTPGGGKSSRPDSHAGSVTVTPRIESGGRSVTAPPSTRGILEAPRTNRQHPRHEPPRHLWIANGFAPGPENGGIRFPPGANPLRFRRVECQSRIPPNRDPDTGPAIAGTGRTPNTRRTEHQQGGEHRPCGISSF